MKKVLFFFLLFGFSSCGYAPMDNSSLIIITKIKQYDKTFCNYYGKGNNNMSFTPTSWDFCFRDSIGKFQISDTINFCKN